MTTKTALIPVCQIPDLFISERNIYFAKKQLQTTHEENTEFARRVKSLHARNSDAFLKMAADVTKHLHIDGNGAMFSNGRNLCKAIADANFSHFLAGLDLRMLIDNFIFKSSNK